MVLNKIIDKTKTYGNLVMFSHTIFSFSFAIVTILLASYGNIYLNKYILAFIALLSARTGANAINRVIDAKFDTLNTRTKNRHIPSGIVTIKEATVFSIVCFIIMIIASFLLNPLCAVLSPVALFMLVTYSYTKRFTSLCHLYLGLTCAIAPMGAYLSITGGFYHLYPFILAFANMFWVAGFDTIYGSQDYDFDKKNNLYSLAVAFGVNGALNIAKVFHLFALIALSTLIYLPTFSYIYLIGIFIIFILLIIEHKIVNTSSIFKMNLASYSINQIVAIVFMTFSIIDIYI